MANRVFCWTLLTSTALITLSATPGFTQTVKPAPAPDAASKSDSTYLSPLVVSAAKAAGGIGDSYLKTAAVSSIGKDDISQFGGQNIDNVLRTQPGVFTRDNMQNTGVAVNVRGLEGSGRVAMSIDGAKQTFRFTTHEAQGFTYVDPALLAGVDVQRGSAEGATGAGALAGSANFRTLSVDDVLTDAKSYGGYVMSSIGNNGDGVAPSGAGAFRVNDTFAVLGALSYRKTYDYQNGLGQTVPFTGQETMSGLGKIEITPSLDQKLTISGVFYKGDFVANSYPQTIYNKTGTVRYDYTPSENELVDLHANFYVNDTTMLYGKSASIPGGGSAQGRIIDDLGLGLDVTNTSRGTLGTSAVAATYGFSVSGSNVNVKNNSTSTDSGVNPSGVSKLASIYNSTTVSVGPVDLTGGLHYDYYTVNGQASAKAGNPLGLPVGTFDVNSAQGRLNPSAKIALNAIDWFQPYVSYAETFRPPTSNELMAGGSHPGAGTASQFIPNPKLQPEVAKTWEVGANIVRNGVITADDSFKIKADVFVSKIDNYVTAIFAPGGGTYFGNNPGTSTLSGFELQAGYDAGIAFGSVAYTHTTTDLPSQINGFGAQSYLPADIFTATLGARLLEDRNLTVGGRFYAVSQAYQGQVNLNLGTVTQLYTPGYQLFDLFANYKLENGVELGANIANVFNVAYTPALSTTPTTTGVTGRGRTVELTAKAKF